MLKHKWLAAVLLTASALFGDCCNDGCCNTCSPCGQDCCADPCTSCCDSCNFCCSSPCCCEPCDFCPPEPPETCAYNAPKFYDIKCCWDMFITGSFVYMQAKEENLEFVQTFQDSPITVSNGTQINNYSSLSFDYKPAFKVGLGFTLGCDNWDFYTEYFRYHADVGNGSFSQVADEDTSLTAFLYLSPIAVESLPTLSNGIYSIDSNTKWRLEMDIVDFNLRRRYFVGKCLTMQTTIGVQAAWIDQKQTTNYDISKGEKNLLTEEFYNIVNSSCSWGVGAKAALDTEWLFCGSFRLFSNTSLAVLYTDYDSIKNKSSYIQNESSKDVSYSRSLCYLRPNANISLGLGWGDYWCCNDWYFDLSAAYEFRVYWNQNVLPQVNIGAFDPTGLYGDLYLHGLVITARLDF
jgi:hypothetical protein